jgi:hypothetical protein
MSIALAALIAAFIATVVAAALDRRTPPVAPVLIRHRSPRR